ncbi:MAG: dienelactone hydrolase family protein [Acidimicrobiaceae bacterium]|nr:dienelactone hydrolase family protein [Acidimicrobiaceae bacterium]MDE0605973.1 dienelactone hydrolase family protein [Acidimicrobiaceae bacterium]
MSSNKIEYRVGDLAAVGHLAVPPAPGPHGAVLVCHEGPGQDDHVRRRADRIAQELGFAAFALDYHGGAAILGPDAYLARLLELRGDYEQLQAVAQAGLDVLVAQPSVDAGRVAAIGYCFGGTMALELARAGADLRATVGLHSGLEMSEAGSASNISGRVLVAVGDQDPLIPRQHVDAFRDDMLAAGVDCTIEIHPGAAHSFTNADADAWGVPGIAYDAAADHASWDSMAAFLRDAIG